MRHKHADLICAWANGAQIQTYRPFTEEWIDTLAPAWVEGSRYRVKPEPKPDFVRNFEISKNGSVLLNSDSMNIRLTFDGETGELKAAEVMK
jgi:hypothetical protein